MVEKGNHVHFGPRPEDCYISNPQSGKKLPLLSDGKGTWVMRVGLEGRHEWSFGKWGSVMTQGVLGALPGRGSQAGRASLRWIKASRLMRRKTSTDIVKFE